MMATRLGGAFLTLALVSVFLLGVVAPALASCAEPVGLGRAIAQANTVFVGTVTGLEHGDRVATFSVGQVWKGDVGASVVVTGGPSVTELEAARAQGSDVATSGDRTYVLGETYLVVAHGRDGEVLRDNSCSQTQLWGDDLAVFRPASFEPSPVTPAPESPGGVTFRLPWVGVVAVAGLVAGVVAIGRHLRRPPRTGHSAA